MKALITLFWMALAGSLAAQNWQAIGPPGGYFKEFTYHPVDSSTVYAGSDDGGGIWKSTDRGSSWDLLTADFPNMTGWSIAIDGSAPDVVYTCDVYGRYGLLKSTDAGNSWSQITNGLSSQYDRMVSGIALKTSDTLFISTGEGASTTPPRPGNGVFRSYDGGNSWSPAGLQGTTILAIATNVFGTVFAGTESAGLPYTNDNGATWIPHPQIPPTAVVSEIDVRDSVIVVASSAGVFLSTNWGINFANTGLAGDFNFDVAIVRTSPTIDLLASTFAGLQAYSSANSTWAVVSDSLIDGQLVIAIGVDQNQFLIGTFSNSPLYVSNNSGANFSAVIGSPVATELNALIIDPNDPDRMVTGLLGTYNLDGNFNDRGIYQTTDGGISWTRHAPKAHILCLQPNPQDFDQVYVGTFAQGLFKTNDGFASLTPLSTGRKLIGDVAVSTADTQVVLISEIDLDSLQATVLRSNDGGQSFAPVASAVANRLCFHSTNEDTVYAGTQAGILRSTDYGLTWGTWLLPGEDILALYPADGGLYAGTDGGELYRIDHGTAVNITGNWARPVQLKNIFQNGNRLVIGLNGAEQDTTLDLNGSLWVSDDGGISWTEATSDLTHTNVYGNGVIGASGPDLLVGTYGGGLFRAAGLALHRDLEPERAGPLHAFPNPAGDHIQLRHPTGGILAYQLLDMKGNVIRSRNEDLYTDTNEVTVDLDSLPTGMYLIQVTLEDGSVATVKIRKQAR